MIDRIVIRDNEKLPLGYAKTLPAFANGKEYKFKDGVNVIVGANGCGKTTLLKTMKMYLLVPHEQCSNRVGQYMPSAVEMLYPTFGEKILNDGADLYADYTRNTFAFKPQSERDGDYAMESFRTFGDSFELKHRSSGQQTSYALASLFHLMFSHEVALYYDYYTNTSNEKYLEYVDAHKVDCAESWTLLMDEPDNSMDIDNVMEVYGILSERKANTQVIAVVHNPLLIYKLSKLKDINIIEMTDGYVDKICKQMKAFLEK